MDKIAFLNFGGIGDEILFSPVIQTVRAAYPETHFTLILEARSGRIRELLPEVDHTIEVDLSRQHRMALFWQLLKRLRGGRYDAVISSGSSPFIPLLLSLSDVPIRVGFDTGGLSQALLTAAAPLNRSVYAGEMYFSLARVFLKAMGKPLPEKPAIPKLGLPRESSEKAEALLAAPESMHTPLRILLHPGVSRMSVEKNILKAWPVSHWQALIQELLVRYPSAMVYLLGGPDDKEVIADLEAFRTTLPEDSRARVCNLYGRTTSLIELAGLIAVGDLLISVDSAPMHMAVGLGTPVVAIFAPTDPKKLVPQVTGVAVAAREDLTCRPCLWDVRKTSCDTPVCLEVPVEQVMDKVEILLAQHQAAPLG